LLRGEGMKQPCRVLFVPGSGSRKAVKTTTWRSSDADVSVGLRRSLPGDVLKKLDVESSTHGELLVAATAEFVNLDEAPVRGFY
jgi:hypothetical protein